MNINPSLTMDLPPVIEDVGAKLPWNPIHPAMMPLTDAVIECGLSHINAIREEHFSPKERKPNYQMGITDEFCKRQRGDTERKRAKFTRVEADERAEPQITEDIAALSSLDNQRLGMYQHAS